MAIDADLKAGIIDESKRNVGRSENTQQRIFTVHGWCSKFVARRGDLRASIITLINIRGRVDDRRFLRAGMTVLVPAWRLFTKLTIGDWLGQPGGRRLLISLAAGPAS